MMLKLVCCDFRFLLCLVAHMRKLLQFWKLQFICTLLNTGPTLSHSGAPYFVVLGFNIFCLLWYVCTAAFLFSCFGLRTAQSSCRAAQDGMLSDKRKWCDK